MNTLFLQPPAGNGMIIQRGQGFPLCGRSLPGSEIDAVFYRSGSGSKTAIQTCRARADQNGKWRAVLVPLEAGGPFALDITSGEENITVSDIYAGDIWHCSGQSNMELTMQRLQDDFPEEWELEDFPLIRRFNVPQEWDFAGPRDTLNGGSWISASRETLAGFSGTAWFFARKLYDKYRIPIGLVCTAWGGTPVEAWMSREALAAFPQKIVQGDHFADAKVRDELIAASGAKILEWEKTLAAEDCGLAGEWEKPCTDTTLWNEIELPGDFADAGTRPELADFCGTLWLCREFEAAPDFAAKDAKIWLGTITDADTVYINGIETGSTAYCYPPRKYPIAAGLLRGGQNRIAIRVRCNNGQGGITAGKPFRIFSEHGSIELSGTWKYRIGAKTSRCPDSVFFQREPMGPYNAMIAPLLKYPLKGVIWYQGESNGGNPHEYADLFAAMIQDWRLKSGQVLPFLFVQLPLFGAPSENSQSSSWALIREAQTSCLSLPGTGMAAALEFGEWNDLHPVNKKGAGERLFLAAEKVLFGNDNTSPGPIVRGFNLHGGRLFITFENCGSGLCSNGEPYVTAIAGNAKQRLPAKIEGPDTLSVDISGISNCEKLLYAWADNPQDRQLCNSEGLPVIPFRVLLNP